MLKKMQNMAWQQVHENFRLVKIQHRAKSLLNRAILKLHYGYTQLKCSSDNALIRIKTLAYKCVTTQSEVLQ